MYSNTEINSVVIEKIVKDYLEETGNTPVNVVIIGANNGETKDFLSGYLLDFNVCAILVEPVRKLAEALKNKYKGYPKIAVESKAIDTKNGKRTLYRLKKSNKLPGWAVGLGSFNKDILASHEGEIRNYKKYVISERVDCITMEKLLTKYCFKEIHLLQIDTEGYDYHILKSLDLNRYRPDIIIAEYLHMTFHQYYTMIKYLQERNYHVGTNIGSFDLIAIDFEILF